MHRGNINAEMTYVRSRLQHLVDEARAAAAALQEPSAAPQDGPHCGEGLRQEAAESWDNEGGSQPGAAAQPTGSPEAARVPEE